MRTTVWTLVCAWIGLFALTASAVGGPCLCGLLENWSFEQWDGWKPRGWDVKGILVYRVQEAKWGRLSAMIVNDWCPGANLSQEFEIKGGHRYVLLFWGYVPSPNYGGYYSIYWYDGEGSALRTDTWRMGEEISEFTHFIKCPGPAPARATKAVLSFEPDFECGTLIVDGISLFDYPIN
jgi:hypothetical protein